MYVKRYTFKNSGHLRGWLSLRGLSKDLMTQLPRVGFIAFEDGEAVAAGFLRDCEGGFAFIDSLISNPKCSPVLRDAAVQMVNAALIGKAKGLGYTQLVAFIEDSNTITRAKAFGFVETSQRLFALKLS